MGALTPGRGRELSPARTLRAAVLRRVEQPTFWLAAALIGAFAASAFWGISPVPALGAIGFAGAAAEWMLLLRWWRRKQRAAAEFPVSLGRSFDRGHLAFLVSLIAFTLAMELWLDSLTGGSVWGKGLFAFGFSTLIVVWFAWSRPVLMGSPGLMLGVTYLGWEDVGRVTVSRSSEGASVTIELRKDQPVYRRTVSGAITGDGATRLREWVPEHLTHRG